MTSKNPIEKITLPNGVRLVMIPMPGVSSVATAVMVGVGSRYEEDKYSGISHFLEHMVFKGTTKYPTTDDVNIVERLGGIQNAYTDIDVTNYHNKVLSTDWELALDVVKELALNPKLEQQFVEKERNVIIEEMKRYDDEPESRVGEGFHEMLYPNHPLGRKIIGTAESLHNVNAKELQAYHDQWYDPTKMVVLLSGNLTEKDMANVKKRTEEWFGALAKPEGVKYQVSSIKKNMTPDTLTPDTSERFVPFSAVQTKPAVHFETMPEIQQAHLVLGVRTFARGHADRFAWSIFNLLMGVSFTSRLFREIREKQGLCYHIRSSSSAYHEAGSWDIYAGVATDTMEQAVKGIMHELQLVKDKGVTDEEVKIAKKRLQTMIAFRAEDPEFMTEYYGRQELFDQPLMTLEQYLARIDSVSKEEVNTAIRKYLTSESLNMCVVWNKEKTDTLTSILTLS